MEDMNRHRSRERVHRQFIRRYGKSIFTATLQLAAMEFSAADIALELGINVSDVESLIEKEQSIAPVYHRSKIL